MSSFFTVPASQRKRKRTENSGVTSKKRNTEATTNQSRKAPRRTDREDSISGSGSSDDEDGTNFAEEPDESGSSGDEEETAAEKRLRLAERYLDNIKNEVTEDTIGFDAADIDRDLIAERLIEDVAESKGKIYRSIAAELDVQGASHTFGKLGRDRNITGCAVHLPYAWTISKDMVVAKWEIADPKTYSPDATQSSTNFTPRKAPKRVIWKKGNKNKVKEHGFQGHTGRIISIAVSDSGKFLATGDETARLIIWDAETLTLRKVFTQHRAAVTSLSFRRGTEQLFSASADRTIKIWSLSELAYIETLFGHQDTVIDIAGGLETNQETCVSVGGRDRTARLWKVVEENQLVFRGGGGSARHKGMEKLRKGRFGAKVDDEEDAEKAGGAPEEDDDAPIAYTEGSIDCVALLDGQLFVTGSDNGSLSLWSVQRKKALFTLPLAHGRDPRIPAEHMSADVDAATNGQKGPRLARYITSIATVPYADLIVTGSWDGWIRAWRIGSDKRSIEPLGTIGRIPSHEENDLGNGIRGDEIASDSFARGIITGLAVAERGDRGKDGLCVVAAVGREPRMGRWMHNSGAKDGIAIFEIPKKIQLNGVSEGSEEEDAE
ncbi:hypothetical protein BU24DRAFT_422237 [Aaosphaeria arxii CBS 175.79]|uniref:Uncharacterized protein n=1 Tax=Aaosphaeria arxii CBS 175.79 TaxID=1450172 RepID=A0A6A5XSZ1_9PLEO|nr:uncharacterized protein BU24DRAFT_422237 [Aaosphaeria arxii CBS 175.79]KAF2015927.1 hypothetical protein BU24DRAFT_422237 [Aaosphaeria arxii CBS 175.79]